MDTKELVHELPKGILKWYKFKNNSKVLYVSCGIDADVAYEEALREADLIVDVMDINDVHNYDIKPDMYSKYDYVVLVGALERCKGKKPEKFLGEIKKLLKGDGRLIIAADNRLGIRYFCGDRDAFTDRNFDSIEDYTRLNPVDFGNLEGHAYSKGEIIETLENVGFMNHRFFSVFPLITDPQLIFSEEYTPLEQLDTRIFPQYNYPGTVFMNEEKIYMTLVKNGLFHTMANGFFIECPLSGEYNRAMQVTISMERGRENALCTIMNNDNTVIKKPVYKEGRYKVGQMLENNRYLSEHGVHMIEAREIDGEFVMPYVKAETATDYFRRIFLEDRELFFKEFDRYRDIILASSEHVAYEEVDWDKFDPEWERRKADDPNRDKWKNIAFGSDEERENLGVILKRGYIDMISLNCFYVDGEFVFYDQEMYIENLPVNAILKRCVDVIYGGYPVMEKEFPRHEFLERYHLAEYETLWSKYNGYFLNKLRNDLALATYYQKRRKDYEAINANRHRLNYSAAEYQRIFIDIFKGTQGRDIYIFGSGKYADKFMEKMGKDYEVKGMLDNNPDKWGSEVCGIKVYPPEHLKGLALGSYKVIICIRNYDPIIKQLRNLDVLDYSVYDPATIYERKLPVIATAVDLGDHTPKRYHIGYIAGVFDMFHIGHLNLFRRAKEQCDYLIVGVVTDESVMNNKKTKPYIPFEDRLEIVKSCRYVDEAVEIPTNAPDTEEAYRRYQFDVQFSGSDYENDQAWLAKQAFLRRHGSDLVFFPYTQSTSSTKLKTMIDKK